MSQVFVLMYDMFNVSAWIVLAIHFNKWWLALFSILTMIKERVIQLPVDSEGGEDDSKPQL